MASLRSRRTSVASAREVVDSLATPVAAPPTGPAPSMAAPAPIDPTILQAMIDAAEELCREASAVAVAAKEFADAACAIAQALRDLKAQQGNQ